MALTGLKLLKVNVRARTMAHARAVWVDLLGGALASDRGGDMIGDFDGAMFRVGDLTVDIMAPNDPEGALAQVIARRGEGLDSLCFEVPDLEVARRELAACGVALKNVREFHGHRIGFISARDAGGVLVELIERAPGATAVEGGRAR